MTDKKIALSPAMKDVVKRLQEGAILRAYEKDRQYYIGTSLDAIRRTTFVALRDRFIIEKGFILSSMCQSYKLTELSKNIKL